MEINEMFIFQCFYNYIQRCLKVQESLKDQSLYSVSEILESYLETSTLLHEGKLISNSVPSNDDKDQMKKILFKMFKVGFIETKLKRKVDHNGNVRKKLVPFDVRVWKLTETGLNKLRVLSKQR